MTRKVRIELDEAGARALHGTLTAALAAGRVDAGQVEAARGVLAQLDRRAPDWVAEDPELSVLEALAAPPLSYRELPARVEPQDRACPSTGCDGKASWLSASGRSATWRALVRDGSVEWTCPACSRTWLIYLQAYTTDGAPAYRDPAEGDHNRPHWRSGR